MAFDPIDIDTTMVPQRAMIDDLVLTARTRLIDVSHIGKIQLVFQNEKGIPYDLTDMDSSDRLIAEIAESVSGAESQLFSVTKEDAENGVVSIELTTLLPQGIYRAKISMLHNGYPILVNPFRLYVNYDNNTGLPSLQDIRLYLRDNYPEENALLEGHLVEDEEIAHAVERAVMYFNEVPPNVGTVNTSNFPWRMHLMEGVLGQLFRILESDCRKNSLSYQAGGLSVADRDKERNYQAAAQYHWDTYRQFVAEKKSQINMEMCFGAIPSPYFYI